MSTNPFLVLLLLWFYEENDIETFNFLLFVSLSLLLSKILSSSVHIIVKFVHSINLFSILFYYLFYSI